MSNEPQQNSLPIGSSQFVVNGSSTGGASKLANIIALAISVAVPITVCAVSWGLNSAAVTSWYQNFSHPHWTLRATPMLALALMMSLLLGISFWLVWRNRDKVTLLGAALLYILQTILGALWVHYFFYNSSTHSNLSASVNPALWVSIVILCIQICALVATIAAFDRVSHRAAWLLFPFLIALGYLASINMFAALNN